jgi:hypothetical protein
LISHYRERRGFYGHGPAKIAVGAGLPVTRTSQEAIAVYRPVLESAPAFQRQFGLPVGFETVADFVERGSALIDSPRQVAGTVHRYHDLSGHTVLPPHADTDGLTDAHRASHQLFQSDDAPVLRRDIPGPPFARGTVLPVTEEEPAHA